MKNPLKNGIALALIPQILLVKWLARYPEIIEKYYSLGLYPFLSKFSRWVLGWIPFSVGDVLYTLTAILCLRYLLVNRKYLIRNPLLFGRNILFVVSAVYFFFHLLWGLNYYRQPISKTLGLDSQTCPEELVDFVQKLVIKTNAVHFQITLDSTAQVQIPYSQKEIFNMTVAGYTSLQRQVPAVSYHPSSIKKSLYSTPLSYMGYGGYLNPFTNEAQVNAKLPNFRFPVVSAHEIGHQIGYSAENETNFIGYLVTAAHEDIYFNYGAYTYALGYCLSDIKRMDEALFQNLYAQLNPGILKNFQEMNAFWAAYENPLEPLFKAAFNSFLKANSQAEGILSYNRVVTLMVAYHQKHPL